VTPAPGDVPAPTRQAAGTPPDDDPTTPPPAAAPDADPTAQARDENFPVALRILPRAPRRHLMALYGYARMVDDIGDESAGDRLASLDAVEEELRGVYAGRPATTPVLATLADTIRSCRIPVDPLVRLVEANRVDQVVTRYATFDQLVDYCALSANPVGELVLHVFGQHTPERVVLSDRICTALQIIEHLQDIAEDYQADRVYLPKEDMDRFGVAEDDLAAGRAGPALRALVEYESERAGAWLTSGEALLGSLRGFARLAVSGYCAGGRAALGAIAASDFDPLPSPPRAAGTAVLGALARTILGRPR
ncbi:MAG: squalene synthase HpnC, partial [Actinocatenispora sp.]